MAGTNSGLDGVAACFIAHNTVFLGEAAGEPGFADVLGRPSRFRDYLALPKLIANALAVVGIPGHCAVRPGRLDWVVPVLAAHDCWRRRFDRFGCGLDRRGGYWKRRRAHGCWGSGGCLGSGCGGGGYGRVSGSLVASTRRQNDGERSDSYGGKLEFHDATFWGCDRVAGFGTPELAVGLTATFDVCQTAGPAPAKSTPAIIGSVLFTGFVPCR